MCVGGWGGGGGGGEALAGLLLRWLLSDADRAGGC